MDIAFTWISVYEYARTQAPTHMDIEAYTHIRSRTGAHTHPQVVPRNNPLHGLSLPFLIQTE